MTATFKDPEVQAALDAVWRALPFDVLEEAGVEIPDGHLRAESPEDLCLEIFELGKMLERSRLRSEGAQADTPSRGSKRTVTVREFPFHRIRFSECSHTMAVAREDLASTGMYVECEICAAEQKFEQLKAQVQSLHREGLLPASPTAEQRADWAFGNTALSNPAITRELVEGVVARHPARPPEDEISSAWASEVSERLREVQEGAVELVRISPDQMKQRTLEHRAYSSLVEESSMSDEEAPTTEQSSEKVAHHLPGSGNADEDVSCIMLAAINRSAAKKVLAELREDRIRNCSMPDFLNYERNLK